MRKIFFAIALVLSLGGAQAQNVKPWSGGRLMVSANHRYLQTANGKPFFWLGDTGWLLPEKLNRDEAAYYL